MTEPSPALETAPDIAGPPARPLLPPIAYPWLSVLVPLLVYVIGACPVVYVGDAGDFVTASWTLGISHPPGYPLYTLLGWLFAHLPIPGGESEPAFRMNLMSGVFAALTCLGVYLLLERVTKVRMLALLAAFAVMASRAFWTQSTIAEVYTLNTLFIVWQWWLCVRLAETRDSRYWAWLLIAMSVSLAHHYSILMFFPFMGWYLWRSWLRDPITSDETKLWPANLGRGWATTAILLILPMVTLYLYLPLVHYKTPVSQDRPPPYDTPAEEFKYAVGDIILRGVYQFRAPFEGATTRAQVLRHYGKYTAEDQGALCLLGFLALWMALIAAFPRPPKTMHDDQLLPGFVAVVVPEPFLIREDLARLRDLTRAFLGSTLLFFIVILATPSGDILHAPQSNLRVVMPPLLIPGHLFLVLAIFAGLGLFWHRMGPYMWDMRLKDPMPPLKKLELSRTLLLVGLVGLIGVNVVRNWRIGDKSQSRLAQGYATNIANSLAPDTLVLNTGDETFLYWYLDKVHWDLHPDERPENIEFTNWMHEIPNFQVLETSTEGVLQAQIIHYELKQQLVARAVEALAIPNQPERYSHYATTFYRAEFGNLPQFRYWDVTLDGLVYKWDIKPDYEVVAIQDVLQLNAEVAEWYAFYHACVMLPEAIADYVDPPNQLDYKGGALEVPPSTEADRQAAVDAQANALVDAARLITSRSPQGTDWQPYTDAVRTVSAKVQEVYRNKGPAQAWKDLGYETLDMAIAIEPLLDSKTWTQLDDGEVEILSERVEQLLYDLSPRYAALENVRQGRPSNAGGAASLVDPTLVGPIHQNADGLWEGSVGLIQAEGPQLLSISGPAGEPLYQVPDLPPLVLKTLERDWWSHYDWRGVLDVQGSGPRPEIRSTGLFYDAQEEEILSRYQELFYQLAVARYARAETLRNEIVELADGGASETDPARNALEDQWQGELLEADYYANIAVLFQFPESPEMQSSSVGLWGDIKLHLGQYDAAELAFFSLVEEIDATKYPALAATARANLAYAYLETGRPELAAQYIAEALALDPTNGLATYLDGQLKQGKTPTTSGLEGGAVPLPESPPSPP